MISTTMEERDAARTGGRCGKGAAEKGMEVRYVYHSSFCRPCAEEEYWGSQAEHIEVPHYELPLEVVDQSPPPSHRGPSLTPAQEKAMFFRYNYAKFRLRRLLDRPAARRNADEALAWRRRAEEARSKIVHANLALVVAMAKRMGNCGVDFTELISEGNLALLRSVEKFDASRGFKFSTYACRSVLTCFHRLSSKARRQRERFPVEFDARLEKSDYGQRRHEEQRAFAIETVRRAVCDNWAELTRVEHRVILERFPMLTGEKPRTLAQVGELVGLTNERVRQIEKKSLLKIRAAVDSHFAA